MWQLANLPRCIMTRYSSMQVTNSAVSKAQRVVTNRCSCVGNQVLQPIATLSVCSGSSSRSVLERIYVGGGDGHQKVLYGAHLLAEDAAHKQLGECAAHHEGDPCCLKR